MIKLSVVLYAMTSRGLCFLESYCNIACATLLYVVIGRDSALLDDSSQDIIDFCASQCILYYMWGEEPESSDQTFSIAVAWRWLITPQDNQLIVLHDSL